MASHLHPLFLLFLLTIPHFPPSHQTQTQSQSQSHSQFLLKLTKDPQTHQYTTQLLFGTTQLPTKLILHLSGHSLWLNCPSSPNPIPHRSLQCSMAKPKSIPKPKPTSHKPTPNSLSISNNCNHCNCCNIPQLNPITGDTSFGNLVEDTVTFDSIRTSNSNSTTLLTVNKFLFSCSPESLVKGLVVGGKGVLGFGRSKIAFQSQVVNYFGFERKFIVCLSSSDGFITSGTRTDAIVGISKSFIYAYTPLILGHDAEGYYINVDSVKIKGRRLAVGGLEQLQQPIGAVEISSTAPYTLVKSTLYEVFKKAFVRAGSAMNLTVVAPVAPFGVCFRSQAALPEVPEVELVLQSELVKWRINGRNLMVEVSDSVMCLGFVDGGLGMDGLMILGGHQLEDHVLEFDWGSGMLGFSSSLLMEGNSCSNIRSLASKQMESL